MRVSTLAVLAALAASAARADTVYLANGNQMKGVVVSRTKTQIVLDIGYGTVTLSASSVARIVRGARGRGVGLRDARFASGEQVPAGAGALDALYRDALDRREKALDAKEQDKALDDERADITARLPDSKERYREDAEGMADLNPNADARAYNSAVAELNATSAGIQADLLRLGQIEDDRRADEVVVHRYIDSWSELDRALKGADARALAAGSAPQKEYAAWLKSESAAMAADFRSDQVSSETHGDQLIVKVRINGKETGRFLVDTGATTTLLYSDIGRRLALSPDAIVGRTRSRVADGREIDGEVVRLDSMQVGRSRVNGALAVLVPVDGMDFDGLLGMTFLSHFVTRVDTANGRLILEDLK